MVTIGSITNNAATAEWELVDGATDYKVQLSATADGSAIILDTFIGNGTTDSYNFTGLVSGHTYAARIIPYDVSNNPMTSQQSIWTVFTTL